MTQAVVLFPLPQFEYRAYAVGDVVDFSADDLTFLKQRRLVDDTASVVAAAIASGKVPKTHTDGVAPAPVAAMVDESTKQFTTPSAQAAVRGAAGRRTTGLTSQGGVLFLDGVYCRELGLNAYSAITSTLDGSNVGAYREIIDGAVRMGVRIVRVALTPYNNTQLNLLMFGGAGVRAPLSWASLSQSYRDTVAAVFDYAATKGVYLMPTVIWQPRGWFDAFGETRTGGMASKASKGRIAMRAMCSAFAAAYKDHPALGGYTVANELTLIDGTSIPGADAVAAAAEMAAAIRAHDPVRLIASSNLGPVLDLTLGRPSFDATISGLAASNPDPIDCIDLHAYADRAWMSKGGVDESMNSATGDPYTYAPEWLRRMVAAGVAAGKPAILTEFGLSTDQEPAGQSAKFADILEDIYQSGVQLALVWNYRDNTPGQVTLDIREGTPRGDAYIPLIKSYAAKIRGTQAAHKGSNDFAASAAAIPSSIASFTGASNVNVKHTGRAAFAGPQFGVMGWFKKGTGCAAFARMIDAMEAAATEGWTLLFNNDGSGGASDLYIAVANAAGGTWAQTPGKTPSVPVGTLSHFAFTSDGATRVDIYKEGLWFDKQTTVSGTFGAKTASTGLVLGTRYNGASGAVCSLGQIVVAPGRAFTAREIADHYNKGAVPADATVIPLDYDGRLLDATGNTLAAGTTSGSVAFGAS